MKKLSQLLTSIQPLQVVGDTAVDIIDLINDSRQAREASCLWLSRVSLLTPIVSLPMSSLPVRVLSCVRKCHRR